MATYTLISSNVLASSAASVTFSAIPATYTDLVLRCSLRNNISETYPALVRLTFNGDTSSLYSSTIIYGQDGSAGSFRESSAARIGAYANNSANSTANTFSNVEIYIPSYTVSQSKVVSINEVAENNATTAAIIDAVAGLYRSNTAITSLTLTSRDTSSFVSGSSFYLYGISSN
jgi:hypothetical protein